MTSLIWLSVALGIVFVCFIVFELIKNYTSYLGSQKEIDEYFDKVKLLLNVHSKAVDSYSNYFRYYKKFYNAYYKELDVDNDSITAKDITVDKLEYLIDSGERITSCIKEISVLMENFNEVFIVLDYEVFFKGRANRLKMLDDLLNKVTMVKDRIIEIEESIKEKCF